MAQETLHFAYQGADPGWAGPWEASVLPATVATSPSLSAYTRIPVAHSAATTKGGNDGHKPRNATKVGGGDMQYDTQVYLKCASVHAGVCGIKNRTGGAPSSSVCDVVIPMVTSVFSD